VVIPSVSVEIIMTPEIIGLLKASKEFRAKSSVLQRRINETLFILAKLGIPMDSVGYTSRRLERMALAFMAVARITGYNGWAEAKDYNDHRFLKTRKIITYINTHFDEKISSGSYDDIRRKDLSLLVLQQIVIPTNLGAASNDPTRAYALNPMYSPIVKIFGATDWETKLEEFVADKPTLMQKLSPDRMLKKVEAKLPSGSILDFSSGKHNQLQKAIIEAFLPRYGYSAEVLYVGDAANKFLLCETERLAALQLPEPKHGKLPDIIAYSESKKRLYIVEAVHSSGSISAKRLFELKELTKDCIAEIVYVTAFLDAKTFKRFASNIAWETEVWIADEPDHMIHYNGDKFLDL